MENFDRHRIRVTLVDPVNWEPFDLYFKILNKFYKKNYNIKLKNINVGYNFLVKNIKLFDC